MIVFLQAPIRFSSCPKCILSVRVRGPCRTSPSWVAFRWYKFVDQPGMQQTHMTATEKAFVQVNTKHCLSAAFPLPFFSDTGSVACPPCRDVLKHCTG